jgi:COMPASS component SPP1
LTTRERQLHKRIEDLTDPSGRKPDSTSQVPLKSSNTKLSNGHAKSKGNAELKKGKKRKAPAS